MNRTISKSKSKSKSKNTTRKNYVLEDLLNEQKKYSITEIGTALSIIDDKKKRINKLIKELKKITEENEKLTKDYEILTKDCEKLTEENKILIKDCEKQTKDHEILKKDYSELKLLFHDFKIAVMEGILHAHTQLEQVLDVSFKKAVNIVK